MIDNICRRASAFEREAHQILGQCETSKSRVILLEGTYQTLKRLSLKQDDLFRQSIRCLENGLYRSAQVMAWAALMDFVEEKLGEDGYAKVNEVRQKWGVSSAADLREKAPYSQIIDVLGLVGLATATEVKALKGLLNKRNESAHPSDYYPDLNETLGFVSEIINRLQIMQKRRIK